MQTLFKILGYIRDTKTALGSASTVGASIAARGLISATTVAGIAVGYTEIQEIRHHQPSSSSVSEHSARSDASEHASSDNAARNPASAAPARSASHASLAPHLPAGARPEAFEAPLPAPLDASSLPTGYQDASASMGAVRAQDSVRAWAGDGARPVIQFERRGPSTGSAVMDAVGSAFDRSIAGVSSILGFGTSLHSSQAVQVTTTTSSTSTSSPSSPSSSASQPSTAAAVSSVRFEIQPASASMVAGSSQSITVQAKDAAGAPLPSYAGTVHFASSDSQATLPADSAFSAADSGVKTFSVTLKTAGSQSITVADVADASLSAANAAITVSPAALHHLRLAGYPPQATVDTVGSVTLTALDAYGNTIPTYAGTVHFSSTDSAAVLPADFSFTTADHGTRTFTGIELPTLGTQSISASDLNDANSTGTQSGIVVGPGQANHLDVSGFSPTVVAGTPGTVTVRAKDSRNGVATGYLGTIQFSSDDALAGLPAAYTFTAADAGVKTFTLTLKTAGSRQITVADTSAPMISGTQSGITVNAGTATRLSVAGYPSSLTAGTASGLTVSARDAYGNVDRAYTGTIRFSSSDTNALLPVDYAFSPADQGTKAFTGVTLVRSGAQTITATDTGDSSITGSQTPINVAGGAAVSLDVSGVASPIVAGTPSSVTVTAKDAYGNVASAYVGTVQLTSTDSNALLPADLAFQASDNGSKTVSGLVLKTSGSWNVTATDTVDTTLTGSQTAIQVNPGSISGFRIAGIPATVSAGAPSSVTLTALDAWGNTATGYAGTALLSSNDTRAVLPASATFSASDQGEVTLSGVVLKTAGTSSVSAADQNDSTKSGSLSGITVVAGSLTGFKVENIPASVVAGSSNSVTVTAQDAYGNTITDYVGTVHFSSDDPNAQLPADATFSPSDSGTKTLSGVVLKTAGSRQVSAQDTTTPSATGTESGILVSFAALGGFKVENIPASVVAGSSNSVTVTAQDAYGNAITDYAGTVHFSSDDPSAQLPADATFSPSDSGTKTLSGVVLKTVGTRQVTAQNTTVPVRSGSQTGITVTVGAMTGFSVTGYPLSSTANTAAALTVKAIDAYGNIVTSYTGTVAFTSNDPQAVKPADLTFTAADNGVKRSANGALRTAGLGSQSWTASDGTYSGSQSGITVNPSSFARLTITGFPTPVDAGTSGSVTVKATDAYNNVLTNFTGTVRFSSFGTGLQAPTLPSDYTFNTDDQGVHTFSGIILRRASISNTISATSTWGGFTRSGGQTGINVRGVAAQGLKISPYYSSIAAGAPLGAYVQAIDMYNNATSLYTGTVHFTSTDPNASLPADYTFTSADNGLKSFSGAELMLGTVGTQTISVADTSDTVTAAQSSAITVTPGTTPGRIDVSGFPSPIQAGDSSSILTLKVYDLYGNLMTNFYGNVTLSSSDAAAYNLTNFWIYPVDGGTKTVSYVTLNTPGTQSITATLTSTPSVTGSQSGITVTP